MGKNFDKFLIDARELSKDLNVELVFDIYSKWLKLKEILL